MRQKIGATGQHSLSEKGAKVRNVSMQKWKLAAGIIDASLNKEFGSKVIHRPYGAFHVHKKRNDIKW